MNAAMADIRTSVGTSIRRSHRLAKRPATLDKGLAPDQSLWYGKSGNHHAAQGSRALRNRLVRRLMAALLRA